MVKLEIKEPSSIDEIISFGEKVRNLVPNDSESKNFTRPDMIPIVLNTWNRFPLMQVCVQTLMDSDLPKDIEIYVYDDHSSDERVIPFLQSLPVRLFRFETQQGCDEAIKNSLKQVYAKLVAEKGDSKVPYLIHVEDDVYFHSQWYWELLKMLDYANAHDVKVGLATVFRCSAHATKNEKKMEKVFDYLPHVGAPTLLIHTSLLEKLSPGGKGFDWDIGSLCQRQGLEIICSKRSWVEHLGQIGAHEAGGGTRGINTELPSIYEKYVEGGDLWQKYP